MVLKKYLSNCTIRKVEKRLVIIIKYDQSIFSANNKWKKVWTLNRQDILKAKKNRKTIIVSDFLLLYLSIQ